MSRPSSGFWVSDTPPRQERTCSGPRVRTGAEEQGADRHNADNHRGRRPTSSNTWKAERRRHYPISGSRCWPWVTRLTSAIARQGAGWIDVWRNWARPAFALGSTVTSIARNRRRSGPRGCSPRTRPTLLRAQGGRPLPSTPNLEHLRGSDQRQWSFSTNVIRLTRG